MTRRKSEFRPDLALAVDQWGTITGAVDKLTWLARIDAAIAAGMVPRSFLHVAVRIATQWLNKETGLTWRSAENLASDIGMAKSSVEDLLEDAVAAGLLIMVKRGQRGRGKRCAIYRPAMPDVLIPDGPGFKLDALIPGGPGFKTGPKSSRKSRLGQPANPGFGANQIPAHRDDLPEEVIPEDIIPLERGAHAHAAQSDRVERGNVTETETSPDHAPWNPAFDTFDAAPITETPMQRADALHETVSEQEQQPPRINPIGTPTTAAHGERSAVPAVFERGREVLGAGSDALVARLLDAERALDALGAAERVFDALTAAANEDDPHAHIENEIALSLRLQAAHPTSPMRQ